MVGQAEPLFIALLFGIAQWKKGLCLGGLDAARAHQCSSAKA